MFIKYIFILFTILQSIYALSYKPRLYSRIPKYYVHDRIYNFLQQNRINNCYEHLEEQTVILLKCYNNNKLVDVEISINLQRQKKNYISIYI